MSNRAVREQLGGGIDAGATSGTYRLRRPQGVNGARAYLWEWTGAGTIILPDATGLAVGTSVLMISDPASTVAPDIDTYDGGNTGTLSVGYAIEYTLTDASTSGGTWVGQAWVAAIGQPSVPSTLTYELTVSTTVFDFNLLNELQASFQYDGTTPCDVTVHVASGVVMGSTAATLAGFSTNGMPTASTLVLDMEPGSYITGKGGNGGVGASNAQAAVTAGRGAHGILTTIQTFITGTGTIQGGGGGGGAGQWLSGVPGSGGGGGGGWLAGNGGNGGSVVGPPVVTANVGASGSLTAGGAGGATLGGPFTTTGRGGDGGSPGNGGTSLWVNGDPGDAGDAVVYSTSEGLDYSTFSGTFHGALTGV